MRWPWRAMLNLAMQRWERVTVHHVHLAFLIAEFDRIGGTTPNDVLLIRKPDLRDEGANGRRRELLYSRRGPLLEYVPDTTQWFSLEYLERRHLPHLRAINFGSWNAPQLDQNELPKVARRKAIPLKAAPRDWAPPILWGHTKRGPLTVLEGNNRLTAYAGAETKLRLHLRTYVGLSRDPCRWHLPDYARSAQHRG